MLKPIKIVPDDTSIRFMAWSRFAAIASVVAIIVSIAGAVILGLNFGIDFKGGTLIEIRTPQEANIGQLRKTIGKLGLGTAYLKGYRVLLGGQSVTLLNYPVKGL